MNDNAKEIERKNKLTKLLSQDFPDDFWRLLQSGVRSVYADTFKSVEADKNLLDGQRQGKLLQERYFRMEYLINQVAGKAGVMCSPEAVEANGSLFAYVASERVGLTQSYVHKIGCKPSRARFREQLASQQTERLPFSDTTTLIFEQKQSYGVIAHNPVGKYFGEKDQALGFLQVCIPDNRFKRWVAQITVPEILAVYSKSERTAITAAEAPNLKPAWPSKKEG